MTVESSLFHSGSEDIFAKAIERVEAGEAIDAVLATMPEEMRPELRELLLLVTATHHLQRAPVPQPSAPRRAERKAAFLQAAAQIKAEAAIPAPAPTVVKAANPVVKKLAITEWLRDLWQNVLTSVSAPDLRLAPLAIVMIAVWLGAFGFVRAADAAGIGDIVYPVRQWIRYQNFSLSSEAVRGRLYNWIKDEILRDLINATYELKAKEAVDGYKTALTSTELLVFEGIKDGHFLIGPLQVQMQYQPDPNLDEFVPMDLPAMPGEGTQVELTFQIIAIDDEAAELPFIVQGISLRIPDVQLAIGPTPTPSLTPTATATVTATPCQPLSVTGWVPYIVRSGENLSTIAQRTGTTVDKLQEANCIPDVNTIRAGERLFAPMQQNIATPTQQTPLAITLTAISPTVSPSVAITATVAPTTTIAVTATATSTAVVTVEATTTVTVTTNITPTLVQKPTDVVTATAVQTPMPTMTVTATVEDDDQATATETATATEDVTDTIDPAAGTPIAPTATTSATPATTPTPTPESTQEPTAVNTPTPTLEETRDATQTKETTPTSAPKQSTPPTATAVAPTPTLTPIPQNRSPLSGG